MPDHSSLSEADKKELEKLDRHVEYVEEERKKIWARVGKTPPSDIANKIKEEEEASTLFGKMTSAERTQLLQEDPERWRELLEAHKEAGVRKLLKGSL